MSQPAISKHLKVLERAGLVARTRQAQSRPSRLQAAPLAVASAWLERYREQWEESFQKLDGVLAELQGSPRRRGKAGPPHRRSRISKRKDQP
jgi:DNA-binding transcriptional ArsR family regulator